MSEEKDIQILRDLAKEYRDIASKEIQDERRDLWRRHIIAWKEPVRFTPPDGLWGVWMLRRPDAQD